MTDEKRKDLLKRRPYLAKWFEDKRNPEPVKTGLGHKPLEFLSDKLVDQFSSLTPSQIAVGRAGTRYKTATTLAMRAGHAVAKDAVYSEIHQDFIDGIHAVSLHSKCENREDYLLNPGKGRRLNDESITKLQKEGTPNADIQIIVGDGLSAWAPERNVPELLSYLIQDLKGAGYSIGKTIFVRFARVGVQDQIGVQLNAKATVILLGERPGLGTGDSLSAYIAYAPKMDQDNSEKNCVSNIRSLGLLPANASKEITTIIQTAFKQGRGGVAAP